MRKIIATVLIITSLLATMGCQTTPTTNIETYNDTNFGFSVNYPEGWKVREEYYPSGSGVTVTFHKEERRRYP